MNRFKQASLITVAALLITVSACDQPELTLDEVGRAKQGSYPIRTEHLKSDGTPLFTNRLIRESSPYLLQHAHNPVNWWAWSDEAFKAAKELDKPILLSIGYSTCHWCHVMERESFENMEIANYINEHFIAIKVDREEHPDIDETYLTAVQMLSGKVGWPLTVGLTPEADAFFGGTYFAPEQFLVLLEKITQTWGNDRPAINEQAGRLKKSLAKLSQAANTVKSIDTDAIDRAEQAIAQTLFAPPRHNQPGFPREPEMLFLMHRAILNNDTSLLNSLTQRLLTLSEGGIHDQVGGGFHRYSVDAEWQIPHFEKMLYNQAQLGHLYALASQYTNDPRLITLSKSTLQFVLDELANSEKTGFYSAMDAESGGTEGGYYLWSYQELSTQLSTTELKLAEVVFGVTKQGNFNGANVLRFKPDVASTELQQTKALLSKLAAIRSQRTAPKTDTKIITAWNAMTVSALVAGYRSHNITNYLDRATAVAEQIWASAYSDQDGLFRTITADSYKIPAALDDYAYAANAFIDLYDTSKQSFWLDRAEAIIKRMTLEFHDSNTGAFLISNKTNGKGLSVALITARDDALYSGNSMAAQSLVKLFNRTGDIEYRDLARGLLAHFSTKIISSPESTSGLWLAASSLNVGETGSVLYSARSKVRVESSQNNDQLNINISIAPGWHINANEVLSEFLIPTSLNTLKGSCATIQSVTYPKYHTVELGFQAEPLQVYEQTTNLTATLANNDHYESCAASAFELRIQACSDEVCLSPEIVPIRTAPH
ncbi:DUF255 domain-containing protein [Arenicella xantha]|uniref:DUF255 domain-containing protein n=1 Tax=Arenicella xantha TaxID=644221 RepID=A0A395JJP2_9GAMM|nr:DUF255 domain-containing protein [Arenicella xantha]RBP51003.1 hypothetical protein DFR28_102420 [Arenicella xantha]